MAAATDNVSSPPIATSPSTPLPRSRLITCSTPPCSLSGLVRDVPRMVPPSGRMPRTEAGVRSSMSPAPSTPAQPFLIPVTWNPCWKARRATPRTAALRPGASPPPVRTPIRTTPSVVRLPRLAASRGQIEHEHDGAQGDDERPEDDARGVVELVATDADDAFEEGDAQKEQDERDADQARPDADIAGAPGSQPIEDHAEADRARDDERPRVGPTLVVVGGVLDQQDQARHRDDAAEDGEALADGAPRGECHEEDEEAGGDDEERPAVVTDVDPDELAGQQDRPDQDEQSAENHRRTTRAVRHLANGGVQGAARGACGRCPGHAPTLRCRRVPARAPARPSPPRGGEGQKPFGHTPGQRGARGGRTGGPAGTSG